MRHRFAFVAIAVGLASTAPAQSTQFQQVFASDSVIPAFAMTSPDGKWIVMARGEGNQASSLWMTSVGGSAAVRLTSGGYNDTHPAWFSSGDRIVFLSTRPNRNGGQRQFLMTLDIDPATGRAKGAPRQVSSEHAQARARPSADGRWIVYITPGEPATLKIVPANGGTARTLAQGTHPMSAVTIAPDGRTVYYGQQADAGGGRCRQDGYGCTTWTILRVSVDGGAPVEVAKAPHRIRVLPADPRYVQHQVTDASATSGNGVWELRDPSGRSLGRLEFPEGVSHSSFTADGWGVVGIKRVEHRALRIAAVSGGAIRTVASTGRRWPEAWMPDGSALITDRQEKGRIVIEVTSLDGTPRSTHTLPANVMNSGWSSSVGPWFSFQTGAKGLSALNVLTGETKVISKDGYCCNLGRGGMDQDGPRWIYAEDAGDREVLKATDPATGATETLRTFTKTGPNRRNTIVAGTRAAWLEARGDSVDLMVSDDATEPARKIMSARVPFRGAGETMAWSWKGDRIAVCGDATGSHGTVTIFTVPTSPTGVIDRQHISLSPATDCWDPQWQPDDSGLVFAVTIARAGKVDLAFLPLRSGGQLSVFTSDEPYDFWNYITSPDGKYATYAVDLPVSRASIHVASFKSLIEGRR